MSVRKIIAKVLMKKSLAAIEKLLKSEDSLTKPLSSYPRTIIHV